MASVAPVHKGRYVYARIIIDRKKKLKKLCDLDPKHWKDGRVKSSHKDHLYLNTLISDKIQVYQRRIYDLMINDLPITFDAIISGEYSNKLSICIANMAKKHSNKPSTARKYKNVVDKIIDFGDVPAKDCTEEYMAGFQRYLQQLETINSNATVARYIKFVKAALRNEKVQCSGLYFKPVSGQGRGKVKLTLSEFKLFENYKGDLQKYADLFCLLVYLWGARIGDVLAMVPSEIIGGRWVYIEQKTGRDKSVKLSAKALAIIAKYKGSSDIYVLPFMKRLRKDKQEYGYKKQLQGATATINLKLKLVAAELGVKKSISTHVARHTFTAIKLKENVPLTVMQGLLNHSRITTTEEYTKDISTQDDLDHAGDL